MYSFPQGRERRVTLKNALLIPSFPNIFSVKCAVDAGCAITFEKNSAHLTTDDGTRFPFYQDNRLYYLFSGSGGNFDNVNKCLSLNEWHKILGHCNVNDILALENVVNGMRIGSKSMTDCTTCILGKQTETHCRDPRPRCDGIFDLVHTDLAGPMNPIGQGGFQFVMMFTDDCSSAHFVYFLKHKSDAVTALKQFIADTNAVGKIKALRSDNGGEFISKEFQMVLRDNQIRHETSAPHSPHQNGVAERQWRTIFEMARCLLIDSELPKALWVYAVQASVYIRNRCLCKRTGVTPYEKVMGKKPHLAGMHAFRSTCYASAMDIRQN